MKYNKTILMIFLLATAVESCSPTDAPQMIASAQRDTPIAIYPSQGNISYHSFIELVASNVDTTAERATRLAYDYGGYLIGSQSWYIDGRKVTSLQIAVPTTYYNQLRNALLKLGDFLGENIISDGVQTPPGYPPYSQISLQLYSHSTIKPPKSSIGSWDPLLTLQKAFAVFVKVFSFLADIIIWLLVVVLPILLLAWIIWKLAKRTLHI